MSKEEYLEMLAFVARATEPSALRVSILDASLVADKLKVFSFPGGFREFILFVKLRKFSYKVQLQVIPDCALSSLKVRAVYV